MKSKKLTIKINKPVTEVFSFVTNPVNTPKWIDFIIQEETYELPPKLGTIYRNQNKAGEWSEYKMTVFEKDAKFTLHSPDSGYNVRYTFFPVSDTLTELEYYEWMDKGELEEPFDKKYLEKLKEVIEAGNT